MGAPTAQGELTLRKMASSRATLKRDRSAERRNPDCAALGSRLSVFVLRRVDRASAESIERF
jgi:hypothetical protein